MLKSSVRFKGMTQLVAALQKGKARWPREADKLTKKAGNELLAFYQGNLAGSKPSTAAQPLPVGQITGELYEGAKMKQINQ